MRFNQTRAPVQSTEAALKINAPLNTYVNFLFDRPVSSLSERPCSSLSERPKRIQNYQFKIQNYQFKIMLALCANNLLPQKLLRQGQKVPRTLTPRIIQDHRNVQIWSLTNL